jgi:DnaJ-class molecular chaperone
MGFFASPRQWVAELSDEAADDIAGELKRASSMTDLYRVLGVSRRADEMTLKAAYRRLAKSSHPDLHAGDARAEQRFKDLALAYETLGNPDTRVAYDAACEARRRRARRDLRSVLGTMSASFLLTVGSGLFAAVWLLGV